MKQTIRKNTFETNSSSIHCLVVYKDIELKDYSNLELAIAPYKDSEIQDTMKFVTVTDKLRYLWTLVIRAEEYGDASSGDAECLKSALRAVFPKVNFMYVDYEPAYLEDYYYIFNNDILYTDEFLNKLVSSGSIDFTTRDGNYDDYEYATYIDGLRLFKYGKVDNVDVIWSEG